MVIVNWRMATVIFICCLLGSVSLVYGQTLSELICSATAYYCNTAKYSLTLNTIIIIIIVL